MKTWQLKVLKYMFGKNYNNDCYTFWTGKTFFDFLEVITMIVANTLIYIIQCQSVWVSACYISCKVLSSILG